MGVRRRLLARTISPVRAALLSSAVAWLWFGSLAWAKEDEPLRFQHLTVRDGLSHNWVHAVLQDSRGFLWFGTRDGLDRFDGRSFRTYRSDPDDETTLGSSWVPTLFEDSHQRLWVGSSWGGPGLSLYDRRADRFRRFPRHHGGLRFRVSGIAENSDGQLWVATDTGLELFDPERGSYRHFAHDPGNEASLPSDDVGSVRVDARGRVWVGTSRGLARVERRTLEVVRVPLPAGASTDWPLVMDLLVDARGMLWIATQTEGLISLEPETGRVRRYLPPAPPEPGVGRLRRLADDQDGRIYAGTENDGLLVFEPKDGTWRSHREDPWDETTLSSNSIWALCRDAQGSIWIGTYDGGVNQLSAVGQRFHPIRARPGALTNAHVAAIVEDRTGRLWVGTDGGGINRLDPRTSIFTSIGPRELGAAAVLALHEDRAGAMWIGTWANGLLRMTADGRIRRYRHDPRDPTTIGLDSIWAIAETPEGELLLAGQEGVDVFDPRAGKAVRLSSRFPGAGDGVFFSALVDERGDYWLGHASGLHHVEPRTHRVTRYPDRPQDASRLGYCTIADLAQDLQGNVWAATEGCGLVRFDAGTWAQHRYDVRSGLPTNSLASVLVDERGDLWLGTSRGLCRVRNAPAAPDWLPALAFDERDGLQGAEYSRHARWRSKSGRVYVGGHAGLDSFEPSRIVANPVPPRIVLTGLRVFNRPVAVAAPGSPLAVSLPETDEITIPYQQSVLSFEFAALSYLVPRKNRYQHRLLGFRDEWSTPDLEGSVTYTNLSPGDYVLEVRGANGDGVWNQRGVSLRIHVTPPFWKAGWFRGLCVLALVGGVVLVHRRRVAATQAHYRAILEERTRLARELHDTLEQAMAGVKLQLAGVARSLGGAPKQAAERLALARRMLMHAIEEARRSVMDLRAQALEEADLGEALRRHAVEITEGTSVQATVEVSGPARRLDAAAEHHLLRIAQEAMANALKHSGGTRIELELQYEPDAVSLRVRDNGRGLAATPTAAEETGSQLHPGKAPFRPAGHA